MIMYKPYFVLIAIGVFTFGSSAYADDACMALSQRMAQTNSSFPTIKTNSLQEVTTWRSTYCEESPKTGAGNIAIMCEAETFNKRSVFFWERSNAGRSSRGFLSCPLRE